MPFLYHLEMLGNGVYRILSEQRYYSLIPRGLAEAGTDMARASRRLQTACLNLDSNLRLSENSSTCLLEKQLREKVREMIQLQSSWDGEKAVLNSK